MYDSFLDWVDRALWGRNVVVFKGAWIDANREGDFVAGTSTLDHSANSSDVTVRRYRIVLASPVNTPHHTGTIEAMLEQMISYAQSGDMPCGSSHIYAFTSPRLAGFTTTNRATGSVDFEVIY